MSKSNMVYNSKTPCYIVRAPGNTLIGSTASVPDPVPGCLADGDYILRNCEIGYSYMTCVGFSDNDGANISTWSTTNDTDQIFTLKHQGGGAYKIYWKGSSTGKLVDIDVGNDGGVRQGQRVELYTEQAGMEDYQTFNIVPVGNGNYVIECVNDPNYVMGMTGASDGSAITIQRYRDIYGQKWQITKASSDTENPVVSNVNVVFEGSSKRFKITGNYSDNVGVTRCRVAAWTENNGQDDLVWYDMTMSGGSAYVYVPMSDHNNETGVYNFHMYAYDAADNEHAVGVRLSPDSLAFNSTNFPDSKFREYLKQWDYDQNGGLTADEIAKIEIISIPNMGITSVKGIEYLTALKYFSCENNSITSIDLSNNPNVLAINCADNSLTSLNVSKCPKIENVYCKNNKLTELNVSNNTAINKIVCDNNLLTKLDLSKNTALQILKCSNNKLRCLNLNNNTSITTFEASGNSFNLNIVTSYALSNFSSYGLVASRTSNWTNADYDSSIGHITDICGDTVTYDYDCGNGHTMKVTIVVDSFTEYLPINSTNFPDSNFRSYISSFDKNGNGGLSVKEIAAVTSINVSGKSISSLKGIEYFTSLTSLDCSNNSLTSLDVTNLTSLTTLICNNNSIASLDITKCTKLKKLVIDYTRLHSIDLSKNTALETFSAVYVPISSISFNSSALKSVNVSRVNISYLDISNAPNLEYLKVSKNWLAYIDVSSNKKLETFICESNIYYVGDIVNKFSLSDIKGFDPAKASNWSGAKYDAASNTLYDFTGNDVTYTYDCGNGFKADFTIHCTSYTYYIDINSDNFPDSDFRSYVEEKIDTDKDGKLSKSEIEAVTSISLERHVDGLGAQNLTGIEYFKNLTDLNCSMNRISSLDLSLNTALKTLDCSYNKLSALDISKNTALTSLNCENNNITNLNADSNTMLQRLECADNELSSIDISKNTLLEFLSIYGNQLTELDVSKNIKLTEINVHTNKLTSLELGTNTLLKELTCTNNNLTSLDLSNNSALTIVRCLNNTYNIGTVNVSYSLSGLPGFDPSKASNWNGAEYDSSTNSLKNFTSTTVTYTYDLGKGFRATFTLSADAYNSVYISANPTNVTVIEGLDATLSVTAEGSSLKYYWQKYTDNGWVTISGAVDPVLTLNNVTSDMNGCRYRCIVCGTNLGIISRSATITVIPAEQVTVSQVKNMTIEQCISFVNTFISKQNDKNFILTDAQLYAIERVLKYDNIEF
ncbi:MAG: GBS Bsp-like repeat-containing protein [Oscillospiraceae bacterium]